MNPLIKEAQSQEVAPKKQRLHTAAMLAENAAGLWQRTQRRALSTGIRARKALGGLRERLEIHRGFVILALLLGFCIIAFRTLYYPTYVVTVNGVEIGKVQNQGEFDQALNRAQSRVSEILNAPYQMNLQGEYKFVHTYGDQYVSSASMEGKLLAQVEEIKLLYTLTVDGTVIGAGQEETSVQKILDDILDVYIEEDTTSAVFLEEVAIELQHVPADTLQDTQEIMQRLTAVTGEDRTHVVEKGETLEDVALRNALTLTQLLKLNPSLPIEGLEEGDELVVEMRGALVSVMTERTVQYTDEIPFQTEEIEDDTMYEGDTQVLTQGATGLRDVEEYQVLKNGQVVEKTVLSESVLSEPVTKVISVGTAPRPKTAPNGYFIWPTSGNVTSTFGYRNIFGSTSFHNGIDIANPKGSAIYASDGGTVVFTGYQGSYGNLVKVDHGNGRMTYYAHCSSMLVSVGDKVFQGQTIATTGTTGRTTGNHLHFEIQINGNAVDPLSYLS